MDGMVMAGALPMLTGFGNEHATEAEPGALPRGRNSPQRPPLGLYAEQLSGTAFTAPRGENRRTWTYRIRPSAAHGPFRRIEAGTLASAPFRDLVPDPNRMRWAPMPAQGTGLDFVAGLFTIGGNGDASTQAGVAIHLYRADQPMRDRYFACADGEMLIVPQAGRLSLRTELGRMVVAPGSFAVIPRGLRFAVDLPDASASGYVLENYGAHLRLPELGPIGANGLANPRDFLHPVAAYEERKGPVHVVQKWGGTLWEAEYDHSPLDVVAWHGNLAPYVYDLETYMALGTVSFDHPDPSIYTVLTAPSDTPGTANADFVVFKPRWLVAEDTFRPPWFHRNVMTEFMGLVHGMYDAKAEGFVPGAASLHNCMQAHGPDAESWERASAATLNPHKLTDTLAFMFETRWPVALTHAAFAAGHREQDYDSAWAGFPAQFKKPVR